MIEIKHVSKKFSNEYVLKDIDLENEKIIVHIIKGLLD